MGKSSLSLSLSVLIVLSVVWKPAFTDDKCTAGCKGSASTPSFLTGHKYNYGVEGTVSIYLTGADKQETSVKLVGQVSVSALGNCAHVLKVTNLLISGPDGKKYQKPTGLDKPIRFTLQDGYAGAEICAEEGDTRRSLNIKRAIISLLQSGQKSSSEVDIFGICPTEASSSQEGGATLLHRSRDLNRCGHREHGRNDLITAVYNPQADIKTSQVLQSSLNVESKLNNGIPEKVSAIEEHLYKPFSVGDNGARSKVLTKLTLTGHAAGADSGNFKEVRSIIFENPHGHKSEHSNLNAALAAVKDVAKTVATLASSKSAGNFAQLVRIFRTTSKEDLQKVFNQIKGNSLEKRVFLDGLLRAGTGASIDVSIHLLKAKELSPIEQKLVFLSLGNAKYVNDEAVKSAVSLLDIPNIPKEVYLGVGALAGAYCRSHSCHNTKQESIVALSNKLAGKLQNCKPKGKAEEDYVVAALKGIRSIRHLEENLIDKLVHCANDNGVKARVRVAALEAFHADPCAAKIKKSGLDLLKNRQLDSEIRIKAYLAVIECPCGKSANEIKTLLETEPVHQVGRFITSSLRHIRSSTNPDKRLARQHYGLIGTPNKFNVDDRKYSFYREGSFEVSALGIGGSVEQTVIYSQDSFMPRSASLNLTAEVFGHNLNVFEVGGRQGNLDRVVEHFLGPKGIFRTEDPQSLYDDLVKRFNDAEKKFEGKIRGRRSIKTDVDSFDNKVKAEAAPYDNELDMDIYVKLFGTDAVFLSFGDDKGFDFNRVLDELLHYVETGINHAKKFQQEVRAHLLFLDAEIAYATSTGLPLKLNLVGAATGRLEVGTNIDLRQILRDPKNAKLDIKLIPSTDIEIAGSFLIDADAVATGLKVVTNLHSSTGGHIIAKILENGQGFDLQLGLPIDKQEILTASNDLIYVTREKGQKEKEIAIKVDTDRKEYTGCFDQLADLLGLTLCGEVSVPFSVSGPDAQASLQKFFARYPLTGSSKIKLHLEKNDLRGYHVKGILKRDQPNRGSFELLFEAEGSKNRKTAVAGDYVYTNDEKSVTLSLDSPIKTLYGQIAFVTKSNEVAATVKAKMDDQEYFARAGFNVQGNDQRKVFKPVLEYQMPGGQGNEKKSLKIDGQVIKEERGPATKYSLQGIKINLPNNEVVDVNGNVEVQPERFETELNAKKGEHSLKLISSYKKPEFNIEFQNTLNPYVNFKLNSHNEIQKDNIHNDIELYYGGDLKSRENRVSLNQIFKYHKNSPEDYGLITKNKFAIHAIPLIVKFDAEVDPKKVDVELEGQYADKKVDFDLEARTHIKKAGDYSVKAEATFNKRGVEIFSKRDIVSADKSNMENYVVIKNIGKYELSGVVLHKTKPHDMNVGAVGHFKITGGGKSEDIKFDIGAIENANQYASHAKISRGKDDLLDFLLKFNRGNNPNGQLKFLIKESIAANGQYKVIDADGKGIGTIIVDFKKSERKIKGEVKFQVKEPVYNADVDLFLNFEKDNADKVHLSTQTKRTDKAYDSKNKFEYAGKKFELNVNKDGLFDEGKMSGNVEVVLPTERCLTLKYNRDVTYKDHTANGQAEFILSDAAKRGAASSSISYKGKVINTNFEKDIINYEGQIAIKTKDGKSLENNFYFKDLPEGDHYKAEFKSDLRGNLIPSPASLSASMEYSDPEKSLIDGFDKYRVKGNYGDDYNIDLTGKSETKLFEKGDKKVFEENSIQVRLPFEKFREIKIVNNVLFLLPENKDVSVEYSVVNSLQVNADTYKVDASGKLGQHEGFSKVKLVLPHVDPFSLDASYKSNLEGEKKTGGVEIKSTYGKGKTANLVVDATSIGNAYDLAIKANAPQAEKLKKLEISFASRRPTAETFSSTVVVDADGRVYKSESQVVYSKSHPVLDWKYTSPSAPQPSRLYIKGNTLSSNQGKLEVKIENIRDLSLDATVEGQVEKEAVVLKLTADSEKLNLKGYKIEISSKDAGSGKRLEVHSTNNGKNVFSGSTSFISKQEGPKMIIEGSGSVKVQEEQKSATFKFIRTMLTEGSEQGVETFVNVGIGESSYVAESRITNAEYKNSLVYCEEKKQCAHAELHSKINVQKPGILQHSVNVGLDLRKLGFAPEFGLQMNSEVGEKKLPQYTLDVHMNKEDKKYHVHVYSTPEHGKFPQGITVTLPTRVLALESELTYPTDKALPFPIKGEVSMNLDKNKPQLKSALRMLIDVTGSEQQHAAIAEFGYSHPKLGKEALIKVRGNLQRPSERGLKIESGVTFSHPSLGADREAKFLIEGSPEHIKLYIESPIVKIIDLEGRVVVRDNLQEGEMNFSLLQGKPVQLRAVARDYQYFELSTGYTEEAQRRLMITGHIDPEKRVDISADIVLPGEKKNIVHGALFLQDNLVKSDYGLSKDNFNYFVTALKNDLNNLKDRIQQIGDKANADFKNVIQKVEPKIKELGKSYQQEAQKLVSELANDQVLKDLSRGLDDIVKFVASIIDELLGALTPIVDKIQATVKEICDKICEHYEKQIGPQVKELYKTLAALTQEYLDGVLDVVAHFAAIVTDFFEKHKAELQELTNTLAEIFKDLSRLIVAQLKELRIAAAQLFTEVTQQIKDMPVFAMIKERIEELSVPDQAVALLNEAIQAARLVLPTEESKALADAVSTYVNKKLRREKVDDSAELRAIYQKLTVAVASIVQVVRQQLGQFGVPVFNFNALRLPSSPGTPIGGALPALSVLNQLISGDIVNPLDLIRAYRPRSLNPLEEVPSKLRAVVVNGQHIFTFDGRHLTFPGTCRYVLVHEYVDRNFTLLIQQQAGAAKALVLQDKGGVTIELRENGQVAVNGAVHGYPVIEKDSFAFREPNGRIGLGTSYGLIARCTPKLTVCYIEVNGFYHGKLRGLLGDGNNEPFDDFRIPNGKIVSSEAEFGNAYRLSGSCPQVKTPEHSHHQHHSALPAACEQVFGASSTLRPLSLLLDVTPFRQACIHAVAANEANAINEACDLARGYTALAVTGLLPAVLPAVCVKCTDADQPREIGEGFTVKLPAKQADIIVTFETTKANEKPYKEVLVPVVSQVVDSLKAKHIDDIKVYLVGITPKMPYPIVYDTDNKLKTAKVKFDDESRYPALKTIKTGCEKADEIEAKVVAVADEIRIRLGLTNVVAGYTSTMDLPTRPGAVKAIISSVAEPCKSQALFVELLRALAYNVHFNMNAFTHFLFTDTTELKIGNGQSAANVVGYDDKTVLMLGDKKRGRDSEALRETLQMREDSCINFFLHTKGVVFSTTNALSGAQQKQFIHSAAAAVVERMTHDALSLACRCAYVDPFRARSVCAVQDRKEARRRK